MAGEGKGWGQQPSKGDMRLATGLSMVSLSQGTPPALLGTSRGPWGCFCRTDTSTPCWRRIPGLDALKHQAQVIPLMAEEKVEEFQARSRSSSTEMG